MAADKYLILNLQLVRHVAEMENRKQKCPAYFLILEWSVRSKTFLLSVEKMDVDG